MGQACTVRKIPFVKIVGKRPDIVETLSFAVEWRPDQGQAGGPAEAGRSSLKKARVAARPDGGREKIYRTIYQ